MVTSASHPFTTLVLLLMKSGKCHGRSLLALSFVPSAVTQVSVGSWSCCLLSVLYWLGGPGLGPPPQGLARLAGTPCPCSCPPARANLQVHLLLPPFFGEGCSCSGTRSSPLPGTPRCSKNNCVPRPSRRGEHMWRERRAGRLFLAPTVFFTPCPCPGAAETRPIWSTGSASGTRPLCRVPESCVTDERADESLLMWADSSRALESHIALQVASIFAKTYNERERLTQKTVIGWRGALKCKRLQRASFEGCRVPCGPCAGTKSSWDYERLKCKVH